MIKFCSVNVQDVDAGESIETLKKLKSTIYENIVHRKDEGAISAVRDVLEKYMYIRRLGQGRTP